MATIPELTLRRAEKLLKEFCARRIPVHVKLEIRLTFERRGGMITLIEERPKWDDPDAPWTRSPIARFDYDAEHATWELRCRDRNGRWHRYERIAPSSSIATLIGEVDRDATGIFWG